MNRIVFTGFFMMAAMMVLLLKTRLQPAVVFIVLSLAAGAGMGISVSDLPGYITRGLQDVLPIALMFACAILFFGLLDSAGVFEWLTGMLKRRVKRNVRSVMIFTVLISVIAHLSGSGAVSYLIVANACRDIYEKNNIPTVKLMCLCSLTFGVMNMTPWGGPCGRLAAALHTSPMDIWRYCIPAQLMGLGIILLLTVFLSRGCGKAELSYGIGKQQETPKPERLRGNVLILAAVVLLLMIVPIQPFLIFAAGAAALMFVNYKGTESLIQITGKYLKQALPVVTTVAATGVMAGVFTYSPLPESMADFFAAVLPQTVASHAHVFLGAGSNVLSWVVSGEVQIFGLAPAAAELVEPAGISAAAAGAAFLIPYSALVFVLPTTASVHLGLSVCGVDLQDHLRETYKWAALCSLAMLGGTISAGILPI